MSFVVVDVNFSPSPYSLVFVGSCGVVRGFLLASPFLLNILIRSSPAFSKKKIKEGPFGQFFNRKWKAQILTRKWNHIRACSVSSQFIWIEWDWMGLNPKQVKLLKNFFQSHPIHVY
jgi:uncharacterized membrane protein YbaN (DUF454 family)